MTLDQRGELRPRDARLQAQPAFQRGHAISGDRQFRFLSILETRQHAPAKHGVQFEEVIEIQDRGAMNADESTGIELLFEFGNCHVHDVTSFQR